MSIYESGLPVTGQDFSIAKQRMVGQMRAARAENAGEQRDRRDYADTSILQKPEAFPEYGEVSLTTRDLTPGRIGLLQFDADFREALADTTAEDSFSDAYVGHANAIYKPEALVTRDINDPSNRYVLSGVFNEWKKQASAEERTFLGRLAAESPEAYRREIDKIVRGIAVSQMGYEDPANPQPFNAAERQNRQLQIKGNREYLTTGVDPRIAYGLESIERGRDLGKWGYDSKAFFANPDNIRFVDSSQHAAFVQIHRALLDADIGDGFGWVAGALGDAGRNP